mmetsp:Transcript_29290/g.39003  ORF Transcript_29290/g.39003 Transcript_29290/m.39003 type:complete len:95 (+) Transcript_29290:1-285(+)
MGLRRIEFYRAQGVFAAPGCDSFPLGNITQSILYDAEKRRVKSSGEEPLLPIFPWVFDQTTESKSRGSFDYGKHPVLLMQLGSPNLLVSDPTIV